MQLSSAQQVVQGRASTCASLPLAPSIPYTRRSPQQTLQSHASTSCAPSGGAQREGAHGLFSHRPLTSVRRPQLWSACTAAAAGRSGASLQGDSSGGSTGYPLEKTKTLVETAMLAAVSGLAYLLSTILKLEGSLGYFLPLPVVLAAMRGGPLAGWKTMMATGFLLVVLLGPLRAISYLLIHGMLAATLASLWRAKANFWLCVLVGAAVRMGGQLLYLLLSSVTMNENLFAIIMSGVYSMLDQASANIGFYGSPSTVAIYCVLFALLSVNAACYVFLLQVVYRVLLQSMGFSMGPLPGIIRKHLYGGTPDPDEKS